MAVTTIRAEMGASIWKIIAPVGQEVAAEDTLLILESMKMEIPVQAPHGGTVADILVEEGQAVEEGEPLLRLRA